MIQMHGTAGAEVNLVHGGLSGSSGAEEDLGDPKEADRMQLPLLNLLYRKV